jgi:ATP-binding cassette, subfamily B, multidrug efflux pump
MRQPSDVRPRTARRMLELIVPHRRLLFATLVLLPLGTAARLGQPYLLKVAIDSNIAVHRLGSGLLSLCGLYLGLLVAEFGLRVAQTYVTELAGQRITHGLRTRLLTHVQTLSAHYFSRNPVGAVMTRMTSDVEVLNEFIADGVALLLSDALLLFGILLVLFLMDWRLALVSFAVLPPLLGLVQWIGRRVRTSYAWLRRKVAEFNARLQEHISGMNLIQSFCAESWAHAKHQELNRAQMDGEVVSVNLSSLLSAAVQLSENLALATVLSAAAGWTQTRGLTFGVLVAFIDYIRRFFEPIERLTSRYTVFQQALAAADKIFQLLDVHDAIPQNPQPAPMPSGPALLRFETVSFSYDAGVPALSEVDLAIEPGKTLALVGATGAGKSTVVKLLLRFHDPTGGRIMLDGADLRDLSLADLRARIALVPQEVFLFSGSVEFNIALGADTSRVREAARLVQADAFIESLPDGYQTLLGERGAGLSSGELQLLAFARALAQEPEILILDEATASVDSATEARLQTAVERLLRGRTSVVVAHRLSTVRRADRIVVFHRGRIHEAGTHEELLARRGLYWNLYQLQFQAPAPVV